MPLPMTTGEAELFSSSTFYGDDPYIDKHSSTSGFQDLPYCLHFYYLGFNDIKLPVIRHYFYNNGPEKPIEYDQVEGIITNLSKYAAKDDYVTPPHGENFQKLIWRRICYIAFVMDSDFYKFWPNKGMVFESKNNSKENHTFYDAKDISIPVPQPVGLDVARTGVFCINHMKKADGGVWAPGDEDYYSFSLVFKYVNLPEPWKYDPGGTNMGPPVSPP